MNIGLVIGFVLAASCVGAVVLAQHGHRERLHVLDGDTVRIDDVTFRLVGFDTPETGNRARCDSERDLGERAKARLQLLIDSTDISIAPVACACREGTEGTRACNYGRRCAVLRSNNEDVGTILIREGLAVSYVCSGTRCPKRQGWCS